MNRFEDNDCLFWGCSSQGNEQVFTGETTLELGLKE